MLAAATAKFAGRPFETRAGDADRLPLDDDAVDAAVAEHDVASRGESGRCDAAGRWPRSTREARWS